MTGAPNNLGLDPFPDPVGHFGPPWRPFCVSRNSDWSKYGVLGSKNLFRESCLQRPYYYRAVISVFWFGGSKTRLPSPEGGRQTKSCSNQKTYFEKVVRSAHITIQKWSRFFWLWGSKTCLPSPKGGRQMKSCSDGKTYLAKVDWSAQVTIKKWPPFFDLGSVSWPQRLCRLCGVAGGERVPPAPLSWYSCRML